MAGAALVGAVVVGINPTRRGDELAADIRVTDCQLVITDSTQRGLLDGLDLGLGPERVLTTDGDGRTGPGWASVTDAELGAGARARARTTCTC